ncbi:MAG: GTP cyclohydrolase I FolE [Deltaproteobacteria bacterium]|nr:GTP cyclohydrolase I FolE [Deltaproteobacteria bacterium]
MDTDKIAKGVRLILEGIGEDPERPGLKETPRRVAEFYEEIFGGLTADLSQVIRPIEGEAHKEMVMVRDIPFYSVCEHHLLPFIGKAHIAYIPGEGKIVGFSAFTRALDLLARRPQVQERLTTQLADLIVASIDPRGAMVVIEAEQLCVSMRGVKKAGAKTITSAVRGIFETHERTRIEMLELMRKGQ